MGAVKNHFHDEICAAADDGPDECETMRMSVSKGQVALIDAADFPLVSRTKWHAREIARKSGGFYVVCTINRKKVYLHRLLMQPGSGLVVDHINGDGLDNRRSNLRVCTPTENRRASAPSSRSKTGYRGVESPVGGLSFCRARISTPGGGSRYLGCFKDPADAARAYDAVALEQYGEFARLNFPETVR